MCPPTRLSMISIQSTNLVGESVQKKLSLQAPSLGRVGRRELVGRCAAGRAPTNSQLRYNFRLCFLVANANRRSGTGLARISFKKARSERYQNDTRERAPPWPLPHVCSGPWARGAAARGCQSLKGGEHVSADDVCDVLTRKGERPTLATRVHTSHLGRWPHTAFTHQCRAVP